MNNHTTPDDQPAVWVDGDPLMEAIAAAVWEQCRTDYPSSVVDDPRNIAAVAAAVARAHVSAVRPPATDPTALREQVAEAIRAAACPGNCGKTEEECARERIQPFAWHHGRLAVVEGEPEMFADAVLAVLPAVDRAAEARVRALHQPMQRGPFTICAHCSGWDGEWRCLGVVTDYPCPTLRALAAESAAVVPDQTDDETQPRRGDAFEAWLKTQRDQYDSHGANDHEVYDLLDGLLDQYRLHADTGTPLSGHVCEGRAVGDCDCLEAAPAVGGAQQQEADRG